MSMKNTINRLNALTAKQARKASDFEAILFAGERKYKNSMIESTNAEVYALRYAMEEMYKKMSEQDKTIIELLKHIQTLENKISTIEMKMVRQGTISVERTITETVDITVSHDEEEVIGVRSGRMNIDWTINPVQTAFGLFDKYCMENHHTSPITADIVRKNWSTLFCTCKQKTGMTLGRLLKQYAKERGLNY